MIFSYQTSKVLVLDKLRPFLILCCTKSCLPLNFETFDCRKSRAFYFVWSAHFYANLNIFVKVYLCLLRRFVLSRTVPGITKATNSQLQVLQIRLRLNINFLHRGVGRNAFLILLLLHFGHFGAITILFCRNVLIHNCE